MPQALLNEALFRLGSPKLRFMRPLLFGGIPKLRLGVLTFNPLRGLTFNAIWETQAALGDLTFNPYGVGKDANPERV
jgi:hypothetical protein